MVFAQTGTTLPFLLACFQKAFRAEEFDHSRGVQSGGGLKFGSLLDRNAVVIPWVSPTNAKPRIRIAQSTSTSEKAWLEALIRSIGRA